MQKYKNAKYKMQSIICKKWLLLEILTLYNLIFTKSIIQKYKKYKNAKIQKYKNVKNTKYKMQSIKCKNTKMQSIKCKV